MYYRKNFSEQFIKMASNCGGGSVVTLVCCHKLRAWWSAQSWLAALLSSLVVCQWVGPRTLWWFQLEDLSVDGMVGSRCFGC